MAKKAHIESHAEKCSLVLSSREDLHRTRLEVRKSQKGRELTVIMKKYSLLAKKAQVCFKNIILDMIMVSRMWNPSLDPGTALFSKVGSYKATGTQNAYLFGKTQNEGSEWEKSEFLLCCHLCAYVFGKVSHWIHLLIVLLVMLAYLWLNNSGRK